MDAAVASEGVHLCVAPLEVVEVRVVDGVFLEVADEDGPGVHKDMYHQSSNLSSFLRFG